jgi:type 1 glutamine amidotransferase/predicted dehydrogenase
MMLLRSFCLLMLISQIGFAQNYQPDKILIFSKNAKYGYRHASIEHGVEKLKDMAMAKGYKVEATEDAEVFRDEYLQKVRAIVFLSANQDIFNAEQEAALQRYVRAGGGVAGIHSATGVERGWHWFNKMLGATFVVHPPLQNGKINVVDKKHASTKHLPSVWNRSDEWYYFGPMKNPVKVLMRLDSTSFTSKYHTQGYPSAWYQDFENGKVFYTAGGHSEKDYDDPVFMQHVWGGVQSTLAKKLDYNKNKAFEKAPARIITLDPGHFHAALVQKTSLPGLNNTVHVYGPAGDDIKMHLDRIKSYNERAENPTKWLENVYTGPDYMQKMISEKKGDIVVMSGNNAKKTDQILASVSAGLHVLADKPMCISKAGYETLKKAFEVAKEKEVLLYDIMTERSEICTLLQKELSALPEVFGGFKKGSLEEPSIVEESVHHFYKNVSGKPLIRPSWFMDTKQQGEGIVDVTTHLVDLAHWAAFPETPLAIADAKVLAAKRWSTPMSLAQFSKITGAKDFPEYLKPNLVNDTLLAVYANGQIDFKLKDIHSQVRVIWNYSIPTGGDTHYSILRGNKTDLEVKQTAAENFTPTLYIKNTKVDAAILENAIRTLSLKYKGISLKAIDGAYVVQIPDVLKTGHEAHFGEVMERFLTYYKVNNQPDWERSNMLLKYYITTEALEMASKK